MVNDNSANYIESQINYNYANWSGNFAQTNWMKSWSVLPRGAWAWGNMRAIADPSSKFDRVLRVKYPANSASPNVARQKSNPLGGTQFYANLGIAPQDAMTLSYYVRFSDNFDFVKGGKLPGLFGGNVVSGRRIPDGSNGFSTRYMWRKNGQGEVYAYLPTSKNHGTSIGRGNWQFQPGKWYELKQEVILNQPGKNDGLIRVWVDRKQVIEQKGLTFRTTNDLKIEGIFFSTFFGGSDSSWATPKDVYADFANFTIVGKRQKAGEQGGREQGE